MNGFFNVSCTCCACIPLNDAQRQAASLVSLCYLYYELYIENTKDLIFLNPHFGLNVVIHNMLLITKCRKSAKYLAGQNSCCPQI